MKLALLAPIALSLADKPVFDGTFGANCPPCKEFGQTVLKKLYAADGIAGEFGSARRLRFACT